MTTPNETKRATYLNDLGFTNGALTDLEWKWLKLQTGLRLPIPDLWMRFLGSLGYTGPINVRMKKWETASMFDPTIQDRAGSIIVDRAGSSIQIRIV